MTTNSNKCPMTNDPCDKCHRSDRELSQGGEPLLTGILGDIGDINNIEFQQAP